MACKHTYSGGIFYAVCPFCNEYSASRIKANDYRRWQGGELAQNVWPEMSLTDREILISGICKECQKTTFGG